MNSSFGQCSSKSSQMSRRPTGHVLGFGEERRFGASKSLQNYHLALAYVYSGVLVCKERTLANTTTKCDHIRTYMCV